MKDNCLKGYERKINDLASAVAFAQDVVELARKHGLIRAGRKARAMNAPAKAPRKRRTPSNGHDTEFDTLTQ